MDSQDQEDIPLRAGEPFDVEIRMALPAAVTEIETVVSILEPSGDVVAGLNSSISDAPLAIRAPSKPVRVRISSRSLTLGTGAKVLSVSVKDARSKLVLVRAHSAWALNVTSDRFISAPVYFPAAFKLDQEL
jgi:hypothetical protein